MPAVRRRRAREVPTPTHRPTRRITDMATRRAAIRRPIALALPAKAMPSVRHPHTRPVGLLRATNAGRMRTVSMPEQIASVCMIRRTTSACRDALTTAIVPKGLRATIRTCRQDYSCARLRRASASPRGARKRPSVRRTTRAAWRAHARRNRARRIRIVTGSASTRGARQNQGIAPLRIDSMVTVFRRSPKRDTTTKVGSKMRERRGPRVLEALEQWIAARCHGST